ncbi:MAG: O-antigen ligase family protein [Patescibacteria group bacterium]
MLIWFANLIPLLFNILFFFVPLILFPNTSEIFEFNKTVLVYLLTIIIVASWLAKMILKKKIIFRRTILDYPLLIFLGSQIISTIFSIDPHTSLFGYYSRFHGGLLSSISYVILYWAYVSNMDFSKTMKAIYITLASAALISFYGVLEHFGIDKNIWVQDVQNRVFSTLGQPNWLAAWLVALLPITWGLMVLKNQKSKYYHVLGLSLLFFITLLYTKSRSGILGFTITYIVFWGGIYLIQKKKLKKSLQKLFIIISSFILITSLIVGTPWTPNINSLFNKQEPGEEQVSGPALEVGGTESGEIRKIVWKGAFNIWKNYPVFGSGVETFAYSYYNFRPVEHNLVSEWDFLYNKAHNEYLNFAATTGTVGLLAYLALTGYIGYVFVKPILSQKKYIWPLVFLSGFSSILVTNFFGFSVVPVALIFFLYPAMLYSINKNGKQEKISDHLSTKQKVQLSLVFIFGFYLLIGVIKYWYADLLFAEGKMQNDRENYSQAREKLTKAISISSHEAIYFDELSEATSGLAISLSEAGNADAALQFAENSVSESGKAVELSPNNLNIRRNRARMFIKLSSIEPTYLIGARDTLIEAIELAPTDAKLFYNLALTYARLGDFDKAIEILEKTIELKANYRDARLAYALLLADRGDVVKAREELMYILENISPEDEIVKLQLEELK